MESHVFVCQALPHRDVTLMIWTVIQCGHADIHSARTVATSDCERLMTSSRRRVRNAQPPFLHLAQ
eukprot:3530273-Karenia_brevis.AAC.1